MLSSDSVENNIINKGSSVKAYRWDVRDVKSS